MRRRGRRRRCAGHYIRFNIDRIYIVGWHVIGLDYNIYIYITAQYFNLSCIDINNAIY